jgi:hypothetical protein
MDEKTKISLDHLWRGSPAIEVASSINAKKPRGYVVSLCGQLFSESRSSYQIFFFELTEVRELITKLNESNDNNCSDGRNK